MWALPENRRYLCSRATSARSRSKASGYSRTRSFNRIGTCLRIDAPADVRVVGSRLEQGQREGESTLRTLPIIGLILSGEPACVSR